MLTTALLLAGLAFAQLPAEKPPQLQTPVPQAPARTAPARPAAGRQAVTVFVTDKQGRPLAGVTVKATGPMEREGTTDADGNVLLRNVGAGTYRLRLEHPASITLERELTVGARPVKVSVELSAAPPPPAPPKPEPAPAPASQSPPPAPAASGPPTSLSIPDFVEKNYIGNAPSKTSPVGCTGTATATLLQLRDPLAEHAHDDADEMLYVVAGEGVERIGGIEVSLTAGTFAVIPRGTPHSITRRGNRPIILLSILTGPPCSSTK